MDQVLGGGGGSSTTTPFSVLPSNGTSPGDSPYFEHTVTVILVVLLVLVAIAASLPRLWMNLSKYLKSRSSQLQLRDTYVQM